MAKLIGHYFSVKKGGFSTFDVDGLKETTKQYKKTAETSDSTPRFSYEYWNIMPKEDLGLLRRTGSDCFIMYTVNEDMPRFKALVIESLERSAAHKKQNYESAVALLETARNGGTSPNNTEAVSRFADDIKWVICSELGLPRRYLNAPDIAIDFDGTLCENNFPDIGEPKPLVIEYVKRQAAAGAKIILNTCRENGTRRALLDEAVEFCAVHGIPLYAVNENPANIFTEQYGTGTGRKVYADLYIDDKAVNVADIETLIEREGGFTR